MTKKRYGIQIDDSGDLCVENGHLSMGDTLAQNEFILLMAQRGDIKEYPLMGAGIADMVGDNDTTAWKRKIRDALSDDGIRVSDLQMTSQGQITKLEGDYQ